MKIFISQLSKQYGKVRALEDVSLHIDGGMFGLLGPNGAGKTTLMRIITTLALPTSGKVSVGGIDVIRDPGAVRRQLGYLPQEFGFYKSLNAYEMLDYIAVMKNIPPHQRGTNVNRVLQAVNLHSVAQRKVGGFSGGMKQRLGIAQALLGDPQLLVVDEPTAGLDPEERIRFRNLLARLSRERTVLLSTHIVADVEASCTGMAVLDKGKLVFSGSPQELSRLAMGRVWQIDLHPDEWERIESHYSILSSRSQNGRLQVRLLADHNPLGRGDLVEAGVEDGYMTVIRGLQPDKQVVTQAIDA
ncbi:MAG: ABC transporter ATP-binding protein [Anaerolineales bacterium]|nr:ABC transporter ATP-binding protein [Anaerolineales bacterium]